MFCRSIIDPIGRTPHHCAAAIPNRFIPGLFDHSANAACTDDRCLSTATWKEV